MARKPSALRPPTPTRTTSEYVAEATYCLPLRVAIFASGKIPPLTIWQALPNQRGIEIA